jgi:hypothetical protein
MVVDQHIVKLEVKVGSPKGHDVFGILTHMINDFGAEYFVSITNNANIFGVSIDQATHDTVALEDIVDPGIRVSGRIINNDMNNLVVILPVPIPVFF